MGIKSKCDHISWLLSYIFRKLQSQYFPENGVGLGSLRVTCSPRDPRFAGSNPAEFDGFLQDVKILRTNPPGGTLSWGSRV